MAVQNRKTEDDGLATTPSSLKNTVKHPELSAWREFLATGPMVLVRMAISLYGKAKMVPGYLKHPSVEWLGDDQIEGYNTSDGTMVLEIHKNKIKVDDAKRAIPPLEKDLTYHNNQIAKINKELQDGRLGRQGDLDKLETKASELREEIRANRALVDGAEIERITFDIEDCA